MRCFLSFIFLVFVYNAYSQIYPFRHYGLKEGLPESNVNAITEDHNSFIWIATQGGVCKFDGRNFVNFSTTQGLLNNVVHHVIEDKNYHIWAATRQGVARLIEDKFEVFTEKQGLVDDDANYILEDKNGNIWIATNGGLSKFDGKRFTNYTTFQGLPSNQVLSLWQDHRNLIWVGTDKGVSRFDGKQFETFTTKNGLLDNTITCIFQDHQLNLWFGTPQGACRLNNLDGKFDFFTEKQGIKGAINSGLKDKNNQIWLTSDEGVYVMQGDVLKEKLLPQNGLSSDIINCIIQDVNANIWLGGNLGVSKITNRRFMILDAEDELLSNVPVTATLEDNKGRTWIGTSNHLLFYENKKVAIHKADVSVRSLFLDSKGGLWIGTIGEGVFLYKNNAYTNYTTEDGLRDNTIYCIAEDDQGRIWLGTDKGLARIELNGKITTFSENQGLADNYVRCLLKDDKGRMWFGTYKGLSKFQDGVFQNFTTKNGLANNIILSITQDSKGVIWLATENGLCRMKPNINPNQVDAFVCYTKKDGFASQNLWSIIEDGEGYLWIGHRNGIDKFSPVTKKVKNYGYIDGFSLIQTYPNALAKDKRGNLWIGTFSGLVKYFPYEDVPNPNPPTIHLIDVRLFNKKTDWKIYSELLDPDFAIPLSKDSKQIAAKMPYNQNSITFEFVGIHFTVPERIRYQYKLEGFDKDWSDKDENNIATYTNLPPGKYNFLVRAYNSDDVGNIQPLSFRFQVDHPYWEKWWFYLSEISFFLVLIIVSLYLGFTRRSSRYTLVLAFTTLLMLFEFVNVYIENFIESYTGNIPIYKVIANVFLAIMIAPFENMLKNFLSPPKPTVSEELVEPDRFNRDDYEIGNPNEDLV